MRAKKSPTSSATSSPTATAPASKKTGGRAGLPATATTCAAVRRLVSHHQAYLSYPALYTHVRNKHSNLFPNGSRFSRESKPEAAQAEDLGKAEKTSLEYQTKKFIERLLPSNVESVPSSHQESLTIDALLESAPPKVFPADMNLASLLAALDGLRGKDAKQLKIFAKKQTSDKHKLPGEKRDPMDCTSLLAKFISYLIGRVNQKYLNFGIEILVVTNLIRHSIDDQGPAFCLAKGKENGAEAPKAQSYSSTRNIASFFLMSNYFLTELFPKYLERIKW